MIDEQSALNASMYKSELGKTGTRREPGGDRPRQVPVNKGF